MLRPKSQGSYKLTTLSKFRTVNQTRALEQEAFSQTHYELSRADIALMPFLVYQNRDTS